MRFSWITNYKRSPATEAAIVRLVKHCDWEGEAKITLGVMLATWDADRADAEACIDHLRDVISKRDATIHDLKSREPVEVRADDDANP